MTRPDPVDVRQDIVASLERLTAGYDALRRELAKTIIGQDAVVEQLLPALLVRAEQSSPARTAALSSVASGSLALSAVFNNV